MFSLPGIDRGLTSCAGAEVRLEQDGTYKVRLVRLSIEKKLVEIVSKKIYAGSSLKIVSDVIAEPLAITITGKGVLIKKISRLEVVSEQNLQHLFPALKLGDFYVQHFPSGEYSFISIVRRDIADAVVKAFKDQGSDVLMMSLGPFVVDQVISQINAYEGILKFDGHQVSFDAEKQWQEYVYTAGSKADFPLKIDIEVMPEDFLLGYATAFQLLINDKLDVVAAESETLDHNFREYMARLKFKKNGVLLLGFFFLLLMLNFLIFSVYNSDNEELVSKAGKQSYVFESSQKLQEEVKAKEDLVKKLGWNKGYSYAYLCDQIGVTLPKGIVLDELTINSLKAGSMRIKGQTKSVYNVNDWMYELKQKSWVKDVQLEKYGADDQRETQVFTILLNY
jgi:hypothetical protein